MDGPKLLDQFKTLNSNTQKLGELIQQAIDDGLCENARTVSNNEDGTYNNDEGIPDNEVVMPNNDEVMPNKAVTSPLDSQVVTIKSGFESSNNEATIGDIKKLLREKNNQLKKNNKNLTSNKYSILMDKINKAKTAEEVQQILNENYAVTFKNGKVMGGRTKKGKNKTKRKRTRRRTRK